MKVEILGTGCYNCVRLESLVNEVLQMMGKRDVTVTRVKDEAHVRRYMSLDEIPGLVINGTLASTREVPPAETLQHWFEQAANVN